jgi:hypothetical protein
VPNDLAKKVRALAAAVMAVGLAALLLPKSPPVISMAQLARSFSSSTSVPARAPTSVSTSTTTTSVPATTVSATTAPPTTAPATTVPALPPPPAPVVPSGKGMWIWQPTAVEGGDPVAIIARAQASGLSHLYVRMGSSVDGFTAGEFLDVLLPVAHAAGVRIIGWDFPYFENVGVDVTRALDAIQYTTPTGDRIDGFSADIETQMEYVWLTAENAALYGTTLRANVGPSYPLIATVPRPSPARQADYPYAEVVGSFDAIAPMVYWIDQPPDEEAATAVDFLSQFGKPVLPIGQAYDGSLEGGQPGTPTYEEIWTFINAADDHGAAGVSFWSWQHANDEMWFAISTAQQVGVKPSG